MPVRKMSDLELSDNVNLIPTIGSPTTYSHVNQSGWLGINTGVLTSVSQEVISLGGATGNIRTREVITSTDDIVVGSPGVLAREIRVRVACVTMCRELFAWLQQCAYQFPQSL